jgi:hypothetical protein
MINKLAIADNILAGPQKDPGYSVDQTLLITAFYQQNV